MEVDQLNEIDWEHMFDDDVPIPEDLFDILEDVPDPDTPPKDAIGEWMEELLMNDDDDNDDNQQATAVTSDVIGWSDLLLDEPKDDDHQPSSSSPSPSDKNTWPSCSSYDEPGPEGNLNATTTTNYYEEGIINNNNNGGEDNFESNESNGENENDKSGDDDLDPLSKKRKRQLRNRDAAMRSRERKKIYVKDLEMKSRYMEAECRRLGRLLQCCYAENQMLRISLGSAYAAPMTKPESAVLLLESLLLGSLVWFMVHMCLLSLPRLPLLSQEAVPHGSVERKELESAAPIGKGVKVTELWVTLSFMRSKRCRASRIKMKSDFDRAVLCS